MSVKPEPGSQVCSNDALGASPSLLSFYQEQIQVHAHQHADLQRKIDALFASGEYLHRVKWNTTTLATSAEELHAALAKVNQAMQQDRHALMALLAENDEARAHELADRKQVQNLLAVTQPVAQQVTFFRDCRPNKVTRYPVAPRGAHAAAASAAATAQPISRHAHDNNNNIQPGVTPLSISSSTFVPSTTATTTIPTFVSSRNHGSTTESQTTATIGQSTSTAATTTATTYHKSMGLAAISEAAVVPPPHVLRTVYLPSEKAETLEFLAGALARQLAQCKALADDQLVAIEYDCGERADGVANTTQELKHTAQQTDARLAETKQVSRMVTHDLFALRRQVEGTDSDLGEKNQVLRAKHSRVEEELTLATHSAKQQVANAKQAVMQMEGVPVAQQRKELNHAQRDLAVLTRALDTREATAKETHGALQQEITSLRRKHSALECERQEDFAYLTDRLQEVRDAVREAETLLLGRAFPRGASIGVPLTAAAAASSSSFASSYTQAGYGYGSNSSSTASGGRRRGGRDSVLPTPERKLAQSKLNLLRSKLSSLEASMLGRVTPSASRDKVHTHW